MEKKFGELSEFSKRDVQLFRSSDLNNTAIYFTKVENEQRKSAKAFFEVLRFELSGGDHQLYVRFPNTDYFVEMVGGGHGSGRGDMLQSSGENVWVDKYETQLTIYSHGDNMILLIGDSLPQFNFLKKVASYDKGNPYNFPYPNETFFNYKEIEEALKLKYLKIPEDIRHVDYCYKTQGENPTYFVVDYPKYNFHYNNHRLFIIKGNDIKQLQIKTFQRYRDGGTTIIKVVDESNAEHTLFFPSPLSKKSLYAKWDETEIVKATDDEEQMLIEKLNFTIIPYTKNKFDSIRHLIYNAGEGVPAQDLYSIIKDIVVGEKEDFEESYLNKLLKTWK